MADEQFMSIDMVDGSSSSETASALAAILARRQHVLERLNNRKEKQQAKTAAALLSKKQMDEHSSTRNNQWLLSEESHLFDKDFSIMAENIHLRLKKLKEDKSNGVKTIFSETKHDEGDGSHVVKKDLVSTLAEITLEIQELQKFLTSSTIFLPGYNIKSCQDIINELTINLENVKSALLPKKRFGFSGRNANILASQSELENSRNVNTLVPRIKESVYQENTLCNRNNEYICLRGEEVDGKDVTISQLEKCFVELQGHPGSVQICNAIQCTFLIGPTARALFAENCKDCVLSVACQQLRFHSSTKCKLYLHVTCRAIIEDCHFIEIAAYQNDYPGIEEDFIKAGLNRQHNNYTDVADFNWLSPNVPSPNWCLAENHQSTNSIDWKMRKQTFLETISSNISN